MPPKAAIRKLNKADHRRKARNGPKVVYEPEELLNPLREIWLATDKMCSKRLREALPLWLPHYSKSLSDGVKGKLLQMSPSTIDRLLHDTRKVEGTNLSGDFVWSLTMVDIYSGWTEFRTAWNKGAQGVLDGIEDIVSLIPFKLRGFDSDNGCEFLNYHLLRYLEERKEPVKFTRSRPYQKNDNAHVEERNWTHVRQLLG